MRTERGLSTIHYCPEWYGLVLRTRLLTPAVRYIVDISRRSIYPDIPVWLERNAL